MRIPTATYRIQFAPVFGFKKAKKVVPYLAVLGISDLYASPIFRARKGSVHGYDVVDQRELNPELGKPEDFFRLAQKVKKRRMGWLQDIVPNHMAFDAENPLLTNVLENGASSRYFHFLDIQWDHYYESIRGRVLAPFLGSFYGEALENAEIRLGYDEKGFFVNYYGLRFPLKIESYLTILTRRLAPLRDQLGEDHPDYIQLLGVLYVIKTLWVGSADHERYDQVKFIKNTLCDLYRKNKVIKREINATLKLFNGQSGDPESFNLLESLLSEQMFRLSFWKVATEEINYRRFFSINDLISMRMEQEEVFAHAHALVLQLLNEGYITGLRVDHIDGLYDPQNYLERLRGEAKDTYLVVEKILSLAEPLCASWPIEGTTGYEFLNQVNALFCKPESEKAFTRIYGKYSGLLNGYEDLVYEKKKLIIEKHMIGDINNLAHLLKNLAGRYRYGSDITLDGLKQAVIEVMALLPVYRTYLDTHGSRETDGQYIQHAVQQAMERNLVLLNELNFTRKILLLQFEDYLPEEERTQWTHFAMRFQQYTGPLMAKGFEDTFLYVYNRLLSLNEVGGSPERFGITAEAFHDFNRERLELCPHSLSATATHDTKRGEDNRARLNVLTEMPQEWEKQLKNWSRINRSKKKTVKRKKVPDKNDEYFLYQTLLGAFPFAQGDYADFVRRIKEYAIKAVREAKVHTAWLKPDTEYEEAFLQFVDGILKRSTGNAFLEEFLPFQRRIAHFGILNSLAQTLIKITSPGVPDFYQGTEFWDLNLVDPDNRRPVDYEKRKEALEYIRVKAQSDMPQLVSELLSSREDGRIKLFLIHQALKMRNRYPLLFQKGNYLPLKTDGKYQKHVIAFARQHEGRWAITVIPRFLTDLIQEGEFPLGHKVWEDTALVLPEGSGPDWQETITGGKCSGEGRLPVKTVLAQFPLALICSF
jgi:(1->4)-alpha-D-glucan 1-alpha-D-glucosylmutase